jgi:hypothetical protein
VRDDPYAWNPWSRILLKAKRKGKDRFTTDRRDATMEGDTTKLQSTTISNIFSISYLNLITNGFYELRAVQKYDCFTYNED